MLLSMLRVLGFEIFHEPTGRLSFKRILHVYVQLLFIRIDIKIIEETVNNAAEVLCSLDRNNEIILSIMTGSIDFAFYLLAVFNSYIY